MADGKELRALHGHTRAVTHLVFAPDGRSAFSAGRDATIRHWDLATFLAQIELVFWPMTLGGCLLALIAGLATYFPLVRMIAAYQEARARRRQSRRGLKARPASPDVGVP